MFILLIFLSAMISYSDELPLNLGNNEANNEAGQSKCLFCNYFYSTKDTPYTVLRHLSVIVPDITQTQADKLLISEHIIERAEAAFKNYCEIQCPKPPINTKTEFGAKNNHLETAKDGRRSWSQQGTNKLNYPNLCSAPGHVKSDQQFYYQSKPHGRTVLNQENHSTSQKESPPSFQTPPNVQSQISKAHKKTQNLEKSSSMNLKAQKLLKLPPLDEKTQYVEKLPPLYEKTQNLAKLSSKDKKTLNLKKLPSLNMKTQKLLKLPPLDENTKNLKKIPTIDNQRQNLAKLPSNDEKTHDLKTLPSLYKKTQNLETLSSVDVKTKNLIKLSPNDENMENLKEISSLDQKNQNLEKFTTELPIEFTSAQKQSSEVVIPVYQGNGKGVALVRGSGASMSGAAGQTGKIDGNVLTEEEGNIGITAEIQNGGYLSGVASQGGLASAYSDASQNNTKSKVEVLDGGSAISLTGSKGSASGSVFSSKENGTSYSAISTKAGSAGSVASTSDLGGSASITGNNEIALQGNLQGISSMGISSVGEASGVASNDQENILVSAASSGGSSSTGGVKGNAAANITATNDGMINVVNSNNGKAGGISVTGFAEGNSSSSDDSINTFVNSASGMASGTSITGQGSASSTTNNNTVSSSASSKGGGMSLSVSSTGNGTAGGSANLNSGLAVNVANEYGAASSSATGEGAVVASSAGKTASISISSSLEKGGSASAISSRFLTIDPRIEPQSVSILRKHCDEEFCKRHDSESCCQNNK